MKVPYKAVSKSWGMLMCQPWDSRSRSPDCRAWSCVTFAPQKIAWLVSCRILSGQILHAHAEVSCISGSSRGETPCSSCPQITKHCLKNNSDTHLCEHLDLCVQFGRLESLDDALIYAKLALACSCGQKRSSLRALTGHVWAEESAQGSICTAAVWSLRCSLARKLLQYVVTLGSSRILHGQKGSFCFWGK